MQFATAHTAPFSPDQFPFPVNVFTKGAAKLWSDHENIFCEAFLASGSGALMQLQLIAQGKK